MQTPIDWNDLIKKLMEELQLKEIQEKIEEFNKRIEQAKDNPIELSEVLKEIRTFFEGMIFGETNLLMKTIGGLYLSLLRFGEVYLLSLNVLEKLQTKIKHLEERVKKLEEELYPTD